MGGSRAAVQLRTFTGGLGMVTVPVQCCIPLAHEAISAEGVPTTKDDKMTAQLKCVLQHVFWGATALKGHIAKTPAPHWMPS